MPIHDYGLLVGTITDSRYFYGNHYQVRIKTEKDEYRIAVNIQSGDKTDVMMYISDRYQHEFLDRLLADKTIQPGFLPIGSNKGPSNWGLDFLRRQMINFNDMKPMPMRTPGPDNDLIERVTYETKRAQKQNALVYAWGSRWQESGTDQYFTDMQRLGIHDIHMNQGNPIGFHDEDNGTWQDGAMFIYYPNQNSWTAIFLAFKSQFYSLSPNIVHTDDKTGHQIGKRPRQPMARVASFSASDILQPVECPSELPGHEEEVVIIAALLQSDMTPTFSSATPPSIPQKILLLNRTNTPISLQGWQFINFRHQEYSLPNLTIPGYSTLEIPLAKDMLTFSSDGDMIALLNAEGLKVHGVSYTKKQVPSAGNMICF